MLESKLTPETFLFYHSEKILFLFKKNLFFGIFSIFNKNKYKIRVNKDDKKMV